MDPVSALLICLGEWCKNKGDCEGGGYEGGGTSCSLSRQFLTKGTLLFLVISLLFPLVLNEGGATTVDAADGGGAKLSGRGKGDILSLLASGKDSS